MADAPLHGVCLQREVDLGGVRLRLLDWPGLRGPLVSVPDPFTPEEGLAARIAQEFAPGYRVVRVEPRRDLPYQVQIDDVRRVLEQYGFRDSILLAHGHAACVALPLASWYPRLVRWLVLIDPRYDAPESETLAARALRGCPPNWPALERDLHCRVLTTSVERAAIDLGDLLRD